MHVHTSEVVISQCNSIANNEKPPPPQFDETIPGRVSSFWTHQQGLSRHDQKFLIMTGQALLMSPKGRNASRDGLVKLWGGAFHYLQYYYTVK